MLCTCIMMSHFGYHMFHHCNVKIIFSWFFHVLTKEQYQLCMNNDTNNMMIILGDEKKREREREGEREK